VSRQLCTWHLGCCMHGEQQRHPAFTSGLDSLVQQQNTKKAAAELGLVGCIVTAHICLVVQRRAGPYVAAQGCNTCAESTACLACVTCCPSPCHHRRR
jgi:hypothetical protein